ncbi:MAG: hypothetical protein NC344_06855 [Bacteroidales bacterium]|nr:hypothetical protein [Bacteroidales bacterium]MCM1147536.1 hypothetical protein [Bacteroidales bacterium]MCM1206326.1 hypothetical protein [Bacillota bacterium]MCM1511246.1 hypothetical protein [Clostridium sp.]
MALTKEILTANAVLNGLTEEQLSAIITLSVNDENTVIGTRIGEIYRQMDTTIENATGVKRNGDEKTYNFLARASQVLSEKASLADNLSKEVASLQKEKARLEKVIADGSGDTETKKALAQAQKDLTAITKQYNTLKGEYDTAKQNHTNELFALRVEGELTAATSGIKFKQDFPKSVTDVILSQAVAKIKAMNPEYIDDGKGGKVLAFKDETGAIMRNSENQLNPYTAGELLSRELKVLGVLEEGRRQNGGGTGAHTGGNGGGSSLDVSGAKTRIEAYDAIASSLMAQGMTKGSSEFDTAMQQAWKDNNVASLPEK